MGLITDISDNTGYDIDVVNSVLNEASLQLHKQIFEYAERNGDYLGEKMWSEMDDQAYFHLMGFLDTFSRNYFCEEFNANQYLVRLANKATWVPYYHQTSGWDQVK